MKMYVPLCFTVMISLKIHSAMNVHASPCSSFCCVAAESLWYFQSNKKLLNSSLQRCVKFCPKVASTAFQMKTTQTTIETQRRELVKFSCNWSSTVVNRLGKSPLGFGVFFFLLLWVFLYKSNHRYFYNLECNPFWMLLLVEMIFITHFSIEEVEFCIPVLCATLPKLPTLLCIWSQLWQRL